MAARGRRTTTARDLAAMVAANALTVSGMADEIRETLGPGRHRRRHAARPAELREGLREIASHLDFVRQVLVRLALVIPIRRPPRRRRRPAAAEAEAWLRRQLEGLDGGGV